MFQQNESWASLTQDERDEMNEKDRKGRIKSLAMKYGRRRVDAAQKEVETDAKRSGRNTKKRPITWRELQGRIENTKNTLKPGEVRRYDKAKGKWVSNKEDVDEAVATAAATSPLWGPKALGLVMTGIGAAGTLANTVFKSDWHQRAQERKKIRDAERQTSAEKAQSRNRGTNTDAPARIKDGKNNPEYMKDYRQKQKDDGTMGKTKPGGQWDKLPSDKKYKPKFNPKQNMTNKQIERMRKAGLL